MERIFIRRIFIGRITEMLKPPDLGLPDKFSTYRQGQLEIAAKAAACKKYAFLLDAPTGVGKSLIAATIQKILDENVVYVCTTKQLQDQLLQDFPYARTLKGRSNYPCLKYAKMFPRITAEECTKSESNPCEQEDQCPYMVAKRAALSAPIAVLNTSYFLTEANRVGSFSGTKYLIIDEFDAIEDTLMSFVEVLITKKMLDRLELEQPKYKTKFESWVEWSRSAIRILEPRLASIHNELESAWSTVDFDLMREEKNLSRLIGKLRFFIKEVDRNWVWYPGTDRWSFKPTWIAKYSQENLWKHAEKVLGMSATILDPFQMSRNVGLDINSYEYKALQSPFPKENRPVYYEPVASVVNKNMDNALPLLTKKIQDIMDQYPNDKILVHTVSYKIRNHLKNTLDRHRTITHDSFNRTEILGAFKISPKPLVLLSPSMDRGVDLPQDECRVVIIAKMPFGDLGDPQVNKRVHASRDGNSWYAHKTVSKIIQMCGRGVRSETDYAATYIIDEQFKRIYTDNRRFFPGWFRESVVM